MYLEEENIGKTKEEIAGRKKIKTTQKEIIKAEKIKTARKIC